MKPFLAACAARSEVVTVPISGAPLKNQKIRGLLLLVLLSLVVVLRFIVRATLVESMHTSHPMDTIRVYAYYYSSY
jgi:hypothetical protein